MTGILCGASPAVDLDWKRESLADELRKKRVLDGRYGRLDLQRALTLMS